MAGFARCSSPWLWGLQVPCVCEAGSLALTPCGGQGSVLLSDSCLGSKPCQQPAPRWGGPPARLPLRGRGTLFIREIRQLMSDGPQSSCSSAVAGADAGEAEGRGRWGKAHSEIKNDGTAGG